jgi:hypothetical protein
MVTIYPDNCYSEKHKKEIYLALDRAKQEFMKNKTRLTVMLLVLLVISSLECEGALRTAVTAGSQDFCAFGARHAVCSYFTRSFLRLWQDYFSHEEALLNAYEVFKFAGHEDDFPVFYESIGGSFMLLSFLLDNRNRHRCCASPSRAHRRQRQRQLRYHISLVSEWDSQCCSGL